VQLLKERAWFDIPVVSATIGGQFWHSKRHAASVHFEEAFKAWKQ